MRSLEKLFVTIVQSLFGNTFLFCKNANTHPRKRQSMVLKIYLFQTMANNQWRQPVENFSEDEALGTDIESDDEWNHQENALVSVMPSCENTLVTCHFIAAILDLSKSVFSKILLSRKIMSILNEDTIRLEPS